MSTDVSPETKYETAPIVIDPGDYYGLPAVAKDIMDVLMVAMSVDRDYCTMIAIGSDSIGVWHHDKGPNPTEYLTEWSTNKATTTPLGPMEDQRTIDQALVDNA